MRRCHGDGHGEPCLGADAEEVQARSGLPLARGDSQNAGQLHSSHSACQVTESLKPKEDMIAQLHLPHRLAGFKSGKMKVVFANTEG